MDVEKILQKLSDMGYVRLSKINGDYYTIYCPIHKDGQERKPSCGVLLKDQYRNKVRYPAGWCHCFTCGYAHSMPDLVTDLLKSHNITTSGLDWLKENVEGFEADDLDIESLLPSNIMEAIDSSFAVDYILSATQPATPVVTEEELASYRFTVPYMYERGLTDEIIDKYDIGYDANHIPPGRKQPLPCITFPVRDIQGKTLFFCRRSVQGKYFNYPTNVTKPVYGLYELPENCKSVVICESCLNALTSIKYGKPAVALLGTGNSYQLNQLKQLGVQEFILGFDPDEAGARATAKLKRALKSVAIVWSYTGIPEGKDINNLTYEEYMNLGLE